MSSALRLAVSVLVLSLAHLSCGSQKADVTVPLRPELAGFQRPVTARSEAAQRYFDQGLTLYYAFNHEAAIASFTQAATLDPECAMAYWGQAIAAGPNINNPHMDEAAAQSAWEAVQQARVHAMQASAVERDLIEALAKRYAWPVPEDRAELDQAYAVAMRQVWAAHADDADVGALCAEAIMDLRPWDLWSDDGEPRAEAMEVMDILEKTLALVPDHPGANHFMIHTMEASPAPEKAVKSADVLRDRIPGAGHLVHMPGHIDIRMGRYADAILANQKAIEADATWATEQGGFYTMYRAHNYHFLAYAAMFDGQRDMATRAAQDMVARIPLELVREYPDFLDGFLAVPTHVLVRFGLWDALLEETAPPEDLLVTTAFWHYGRTVALSALGRVDEAATELAALRDAYEAVPESRLIGNNTARTVLEIGLPMAEGELEYRRGNYEKAFDLLREAVRRDDGLKYDEPWGWMMPIRHSLGALLLEQGQVEEAESVYREDLLLHPHNGWALHGLAECLKRSGRTAEAAAAEASFRDAWARSDIRIQGSCFCRTQS